jgi:hypothetical protein
VLPKPCLPDSLVAAVAKALDTSIRAHRPDQSGER